MKLLDTFKKIFGLDGAAHVLTHEQRILPKPVLTVEPVMVTPKAAPANTMALYNEETLAKLSKNKISEVAAKELGIEISLRLKKEDMIETYLIAQRKF